MGFPRTRSVATAALVTALALAAGTGPPTGRADPPTDPLPGRIAELEAEVHGLRDEAQQISGTRNLREGTRVVQGRLAGLRVRQDELEAVIEKAGGNQKELEAYKKGFEDQWVVTGSDVAGEGAEKAGETAARRALSKGAGKALGWLGIALDVLEYGGKWGLKQGDVAALEDAVEQGRVNLLDLYQVSIALSGQINAEIANVKRMEEIKARDDEIFPELATLRERQRFLRTPARAGARLDRVSDPEGDAEEKRKQTRHQLEKGIRVVPNVTPRPTRQRY